MAGRRILDAGCGSGPLFVELRDRGAVVTGLDSSVGMLELARRRLGPDADLHLADLADPLPFPDGAFDVVVASLVLHYLEDWTGPLAEMRRVLIPGGRLILSVNHPFDTHGTQRLSERRLNYFATWNWTEDWVTGGQRAAACADCPRSVPRGVSHAHHQAGLPVFHPARRQLSFPGLVSLMLPPGVLGFTRVAW